MSHCRTMLQRLIQSRRARSTKVPASIVSHDDYFEVDFEKAYPVIAGSSVDVIHSGLRSLFIRSNCPELGKKILDQCWIWYCHYLDNLIKSMWNVHLSPYIRGLDREVPVEQPAYTVQFKLVYRVLETILGAIRSRGEISLDGIIDELHSRQLLCAKDQISLARDRPQLRQTVWCLIGTLTMLYDPLRDNSMERLRLRKPASARRAAGARRNQDLFASSQDSDACRDPLHSLLGQFGDLIPRVEVDAAFLASADQDYINVAYINFYTLKKVAKLDIEWVDTLNLHLQLDKRRRILRLYRFPALCQLLWGDGEDSFLGKLFAEHRQSQMSGQDPTEHTISEYFREIILSYRLLFGIDKKSRHEFKHEFRNWATYKASDMSALPRGKPEQDPLLSLLTLTDITHHTQHVNQAMLSDLLCLLHGEEKGSSMYYLEDFPFLGHRLAELQRFSLIQKPNDWISIFLVDQRDTPGFWNGLIACALLIIGGATIILQFWQLIFQIWSTLISKGQCKP